MSLPAETNKTEYVLAALLGFITLASLLQSLYQNWAFTTDDAWITWRYAEHLVNGLGFRWQEGQPAVEGYSNFSWLLLSAAILKSGLPLPDAMKWLATASLLAGLISLYCSARMFLSPLPAVLPVYLFSRYEGVVWWTVSGLETGLYVALVLLFVWQTLRAFQITGHNVCYHPSHWLAACLALLLLSITRFEGALFAFVLVAYLSFLFHKYRVPVLCQRKMIWIAWFAFVLPYSLYFIWRVVYFGHFFPNSYLCKVTYEYMRFYLVNDYLTYALPCLVLALPWLIARFDCRSILLYLPSLIYCILLWRANPVVAHYNRLFLAPFALILLTSVIGVQEFFNFFSFSKWQNTLLVTLVIAIFGFFYIPNMDADSAQMAIKHYQQRISIREEVVRLLDEKAAPKARVLLADCGIIPYFARKDIEFIDSQCLNNPDLTSKEIQLSYAKYARYLQYTVKPDWVVRTLYPQTQSEDDLTQMMADNGFFMAYEWVISLQSHQFKRKNRILVEGKPDHIYMIYKRRI